MKKFILLPVLLLLGASCNSSQTSFQQQLVDLQTQNAALQQQVNDLQKQQLTAQTIQDNSELKIEKCKTQWLDSAVFPGTTSDFINISAQANQLATAGNGTYAQAEKLLEDSFRHSGYTKCLNN